MPIQAVLSTPTVEWFQIVEEEPVDVCKACAKR